MDKAFYLEEISDTRFPQFAQLIKWLRKQTKAWAEFTPSRDIIFEVRTCCIRLKVKVYKDEYQDDYFFIENYSDEGKWIGRYYVVIDNNTAICSTTSYSEPDMLKAVKKMCKELYEFPF